MAAPQSETTPPAPVPVPGTGSGGGLHFPRITIKYCTQCKWMLRAAYFAQELLSTFSTSLGEVALIPATGGIFTVTMFHRPGVEGEGEGEGEDEGAGGEKLQETILWDRKTNGGFPEVKVLKSLVRNVIDPSRDLGHTDRALRAANVPVQSGGVSGVSQELTQTTTTGEKSVQKEKEEKKECEDCQ